MTSIIARNVDFCLKYGSRHICITQMENPETKQTFRRFLAFNSPDLPADTVQQRINAYLSHLQSQELNLEISNERCNVDEEICEPDPKYFTFLNSSPFSF